MANPVRGRRPPSYEWRMFLWGEPASTSPKHALVLVGSPFARVRSGSKLRSGDAFAESPFASLSGRPRLMRQSCLRSIQRGRTECA